MVLLTFAALAAAGYTAAKIGVEQCQKVESEREERLKDFAEKDPEGFERTENFKQQLIDEYADENGEMNPIRGLTYTIKAIRFAKNEVKNKNKNKNK